MEILTTYNFQGQGHFRHSGGHMVIRATLSGGFVFLLVFYA